MEEDYLTPGGANSKLWSLEIIVIDKTSIPINKMVFLNYKKKFDKAS